MITELVDRIQKRLQPPSAPERVGVVLSGGGARGAYQVGVLSYIGDVFPEAPIDIVTGVSAGAINAVHLANHVAPLEEKARELRSHWTSFRSDHVYAPRSRFNLMMNLLRNGDDEEDRQEEHGLVDSTPLREFLTERFGADEQGRLDGIGKNIRSGTLRACAVTAINYDTGQTVTWVQGSDLKDWQRANRVGINTEIGVEHIMASTALPLFFPAVEVDGDWYGDGGVRLSTPLAPAVHLGATRLLAVTTRYGRSRREANQRQVVGYPPTAQVLGVLANAVFLDALDQDAHHLRRINRLVRDLPHNKRDGLRPIELLLMRPSVDLGKLAGEYEMTTPAALRMLAWGMGSRDTTSPDSLSMLLFEPEYITRLIEIGYQDARARRDEIEAFFAGEMLADSVDTAA